MNRNTTAIILIILAIGMYVTFTRGKLAEVSAVRTVNQEYTTALDNADELVRVRDSVQEQYKNLSENDRIRLDKMLPNTVDNIRLTIDLNDLALRHGFSLRNMKAVASSASSNPKQPSAPMAVSGVGVVTSARSIGTIATPTLDTVTVSFGMSASYQQFIDFLQVLEADLRVMDLTHLSMTTNSTGTYDYAVELKTYWLRQQ